MRRDMRKDSLTLERFRRCEAAARLLEKAKDSSLHRKSDAASGFEWCEDMLDDAWNDIDRIASQSGDRDARIVASHFLFLETWLDTASEVGLSVDKTKKLAYAALMRLDKEEAD